MNRPQKLDDATVTKWLASHSGWELADGKALARTYKLPNFAAALALVVKVGTEADKRDHHPDIELGYGRARFTWSTHDAGGITQLDLDLAAATDAFSNG
jgi:4a-hydroxytetrahydrobiopterin dehydratase